MKDQIEVLLLTVKRLRTEAFESSNEELHTQLGRAMSNLIRAREAIK